MSDLPILSISILLPLISALYITFFISHIIMINYSSINDAWGNKEIYRKDTDINETRELMNNDEIKIFRKFATNETPKSWSVWLHSLSKGWTNQIVGNI